MKILILLSAFLVTANYALAKESRPPGCKDPVYACQDLSTARICGVVTDCIHDIWSTMKAPDDDSEICDICKEMVKEARDQLLSNETQEEIKEVFEGSCELLGHFLPKVIVDECKKVFDDLIPEIIEMLASRMDPNTVCTVAGLCNNAALKDFSLKDRLSSILEYIPSAVNDGSCGSCKKLLSALKHIFSSIPQDQLQDILLRFCQQYPQISAQCSAIVESYLPEVYNYILSMDPTSACQQLGVCSESNEIKMKPVKYGDELTCEFCESLVQYVRDIILANSTKEEFRTALLNMCSRLGKYSAECKELVNEYYDAIYNFLEQSLDPKTVCTDLGLCQPSDERTVPMVKIVPMNNMWRGKHPNRIDNILPVKTQNNKSILGVRVIPAKMDTKKSNIAEEELQQDSTNEIGDASAQQLPIERMQNPLLTLTRDTECAISRAIMYFLEKDIKARNTKAITTALDNVCETWISDYMKECEHFISGNRKKVTELLLLGVPFDGVPAYLKLCHDELKPELPQVHENNGITCDLCVQVMDYLKKELGDNKTEEEIRAALDKVCTYLPQAIVQDCEKFVNEYTDMIVKLLLQEVDPNAICCEIGLCPAGIHKPVKDDIDCELCKEIMAYVKSKLAEPKVEAEIAKILDEVCSILPQTWASKCEQFVNQYTDLMISLLLEEVDPDEICSLLHVCSSVASTVMKAVETKPATFFELKDSADCEICTTIMGYLEKELEDPTVESAIREALDTVCSVLPTSYAVRCQNFVDKYTDKIVRLLVNSISPKMVCSLLQECPAESIGCTLCEYALHYVQEQLMSNSTESEIKVVAKKLCSYLPGELVEQCDAFINEYGDALIVLLAQELDPSIICPLLKLCPSKALPKELPSTPVKNIKLDGCDICKAVVNTVDHLLEEGDIDRELTDLAAKICTVLPETAKEECNSIVHLYGPYILQMIGRLEDGQQLCQSIDLCPRTPGHVHLLGAEKCTFGPSYWCKSSAHAAACKAEIYCKKKVWKN